MLRFASASGGASLACWREGRLRSREMAAFVCLIELRLHWNESGSLKGKRKEVSSLKALLRQRFGASVAETEGHDSWQRSTLLCALVGDRTVEARADDLARFAESRCPEGCSVRIDVRSLRDIRD